MQADTVNSAIKLCNLGNAVQNNQIVKAMYEYFDDRDAGKALLFIENAGKVVCQSTERKLQESTVLALFNCFDSKYKEVAIAAAESTANILIKMASQDIEKALNYAIKWIKQYDDHHEVLTIGIKVGKKIATRGDENYRKKWSKSVQLYVDFD